MMKDPGTFAQLAAEDNIEVLGTEAGRVVTVYGIDNKGNQFKESITTTGGSYGATSATTARYIERATIDSDTQDTVIIRRKTGDTFIMSIPANQLETRISHKFNGEKMAFVTGWGIHNGVDTDSTTSATSSMVAQLRWYTDDADSLDSTDGYQVVDTIVTNPYDISTTKKFANPVKLKAGGWLAVFAQNHDLNQKATVRIEGYDQ
jgi:hypothetical protein